jgi:hypothetical protein
VIPELLLLLAGFVTLVIAALVVTYVWGTDPTRRARAREMIVMLLDWLVRIRYGAQRD